jgi:hypothetical protein
MTQTQIPGPVAFCGLYCGACRSYKKGKCPGCRDNAKAVWCDIRKCCLERGYNSCAECRDFADLHACRKFNNLPGRVIGFIFKTDRYASIARIREAGAATYAAEMEKMGRMAIKRK